jgi:hypothetical protein
MYFSRPVFVRGGRPAQQAEYAPISGREGQISSEICCGSVSDFPDLCSVSACGCSAKGLGQPFLRLSG